jgi:ferredoxin
MTPGDLDRLCPDWREREAFLSGPGALLDALRAHWEAHGDPARLRLERFQPVIGADAGGGEGGPIAFVASGVEGSSDGSTPILVAGEAAGVAMPFGCRMGICHTCVGRLCSGRVRDLRTGKVSGTEGEMVRTCINAPEGPVEILL